MAKAFPSCGNPNMCLISENPQVSSLPEQQPFILNPPSPSYKITLPPSYQSALSNKRKADDCDPTIFQIKINSKYIPKTIDSILPPYISVTPFIIEYDKSKSIIAVYIENTSKLNSKINTFIYSHDEQSDLGTVLPSLIDISAQFKANIIAYDYCNFGRSSSKPNNKNTFKEDSSAIVYFAFKYLDIPKENIILIGSGIGAIPSCCLVINHLSQCVKGMILISPVFSTLISEQTLENIYCPVFITHPKKDNRFSWELLSEFVKSFPNKIEWYPKNTEENNIFVGKRMKFIMKIKEFLVKIDGLTKKKEVTFSKEQKYSNESVFSAQTESSEYELKGKQGLNKLVNDFSDSSGESIEVIDEIERDDKDDNCSNKSINLGNDIQEIDWGDDE